MNEGTPGSPLIALLELAQRARAAATAQELAFQVVNATRTLLPYRQAALWFRDGGVRTLSGVVGVEANAPYTQWLEALCRALAEQHRAAAPLVVDVAQLPPAIQADWSHWLPAKAVWLPLHPAPNGVPAAAEEQAEGGLLLAGDAAASAQQLALLAEWMDIWQHAWRAAHPQPGWSLSRLPGRLRRWWQVDSSQQRWRRRAGVVLALLAVLLLPVHLTVLAPGELVAAQPAVLRAPMDGVVEQIHVQPNEMVKQGQLLFNLDEAQLASRLEVSEQALQTAEAEYRQFAQLALGDVRSKSQLAALAGKIGERRAEQAFLTEQRQRAQVLAPHDGMVLFDAPSEWIGKPVQTGERVMRIAQPDAVEVEAWLPIGDAIALQPGAPVQLYLAADPLAAVQAQVRYVAYDAVARPDGQYAYRVRAQLVQPGTQRIGLKGTAKLQGERVSLAYWMVRKPWASIRQWVAL